MSEKPNDPSDRDLDAEGTLDDQGYEPPDSRPVATEFGTTATEQREGESFEQRINQEVADPDSSYGAPDDEGGLRAEPRAGGDEQDSIAAKDDFSGDPQVGADDAGVLVSDDEGTREDTDAELDASELDEAGDGTSTSPEESAMHVVDE